MSSNPDYQQIVELFGLMAPPVEEEVTSEEGRVGRSGEESLSLGDESVRSGEYKKALSHFERALRQDGDASEAYRGLGTVYELLEDAPAAVRQYQRALKHSLENSEPYLGLSEIYRAHGKTSEALEKLESAIQLDPKNPLYHLKYAELLRETGHNKRALRAIQNSLRLQPENSFFHYWMGDLQIQMGEFEGAILSMRAAIELASRDSYLYAEVAIAFWGAGRAVEAVKAVRLATDLEPDNLLYVALLERLLRRSGQTSDADMEAKRIVDLDNYDRDKLERLWKPIEKHAHNIS
jgi:tetratricopeptide (TPR) repeat protein